MKNFFSTRCPKQIVNSRAFKLPFLKGKYNSDGSLDCHGLPLFAQEQLQDKEEAISRGSHGLVFVARNNSEKVVIKKLLGGDEKKSFSSPKKQKYSMGLKVSIKLSLKLCACNRLQQFLNICFSTSLPSAAQKLSGPFFFTIFLNKFLKLN